MKNAVATLGTSITEDQMSRLRNYTENITLMLDGDEAGIKSALRLITPLAEMGINGRMVVLPGGPRPGQLRAANGRAGVRRRDGGEEGPCSIISSTSTRKRSA